MSTNHDFEAVGKEIDFSSELTFPLKLFKVTGDILAHIVPVIKGELPSRDFSVLLGEQARPALWPIDTGYAGIKYKVASEDLYLTFSAQTVASGIVKFYCVYAKLSVDGSVEEVE